MLRQEATCASIIMARLFEHAGVNSDCLDRGNWWEMELLQKFYWIERAKILKHNTFKKKETLPEFFVHLKNSFTI